MPTAPPIDAVTLEVIRESMISIVREMRATLVATAYSSIIYEAHDFSCVLVSGDGEIVAQAEDNPSHIFPVPWSVKGLFEIYGGDIRPGDVFLHNDPYTGGTHLNDIAMICPVFSDGALVLFPVVRAHWGDVGGTTPGSISGRSTEIFHDGVRIPMLRIARAGEVDRRVLELLIANMRLPRERHGDFLSTLGTCRLAESRIGELTARYGTATVRAAIADLLDRAEQRTRRRILSLGDRSATYEHMLDPMRPGAEPVIVRVAVAVRGTSIRVDFAGSSPQVHGSLNAGLAVAATGAFIVLKAFLDPDEPVNHGNFRPIEVAAPEGCFLNARYPASCAGSSEVRNAAISAVLGAMARLVPERMAGDIKGTSNHIYLSGPGGAFGEPFLFYEYPAGGTGACAAGDGSHALRNFAEGDFASIQPAEAIEHECALLVERLEIREDSGGPGRHRGGCGLRRDLRVLGDDVVLSVSSNKNVLPPFGVGGGSGGAPNRFVVIRDGRELSPSDTPGKVQGFALRAGDIVRVMTSGGGGFGDPLDRPPEAVATDVADGVVTRADAAARYGVVIGPDGDVDPIATASRRIEARRARVTLRLDVLDTADAPDRGAALRFVLHPATAARIGVAAAEPAEIADPHGASLRGWVACDPDADPDAVGVPPRGARVLSLSPGTRLLVRPVSDGASR